VDHAEMAKHIRVIVKIGGHRTQELVETIVAVEFYSKESFLELEPQERVRARNLALTMIALTKEST
jgi:hypothetical protein